jgi:5'-phosphate synthase pdxT subunit
MLRQVRPDIEAVEVRSKTDIEDPRLDGLIIPGGESTTMSIVAQRSGAWSALQKLVRNRPVWVSHTNSIYNSNNNSNVLTRCILYLLMVSSLGYMCWYDSTVL